MPKPQLKKAIGLFTLVAIGLGAIIGSGIFALPAAMAVVAGPGLLLAILISGMISMFFALAYAELGATFPLEGGPYAFPRLAMGNLGGFLMGWGYFIYLFVGTAAIIEIFIVYLGYYIPGLTEKENLTSLGVTIAVAALWLFTIINVFGAKWGGLYSVVTTIGKMIPLILFGLVGLSFFQKDNLVPFMPSGFTGVTIAVTLFFWSYTGFEAVVVPTEEVKKPSRNIPLAMILTLLITIALYLFIALAYVGMINWEGLGLAAKNWEAVGDVTLTKAAESSNLPWLAAIATIGAIIATGGAGGSWVLIQGRMPFAMAKDRLFWVKAGNIHPKFGTPAVSLIFTSILSTLILIAIPNFASVSLIASVTVVVPYAAAILAMATLRKTHPKEDRPFKIPCIRLFSMIGFILSSFLVYWAAWPWTLVGAVLMLSGYPMYLLVKKHKFEFRRSLWVPIYLIGIVLISLLGDPRFVFNNFTPWHPMGIFIMPYDLVALTIFSILIFIWAYKENVRPHLIQTKKTMEIVD